LSGLTLRRVKEGRYGQTFEMLALPVAVLVGISIAFLVIANVQGHPLSWANGYDILQNFANLGLITLALGLSMLVGEFDLSVPAMSGLGGAVAVVYGSSVTVGILVALGFGIAAGVVQGGVIARFGISSVPVTLAGFLLMSGGAYVVTGNKSIPYLDYGVGQRLDQPIAHAFSLRSLIIIAIFLGVGFFLRFTRLGTQVRAVGGDRRASRVAGIPVGGVLVGIFVVTAVSASLSGALLSYSLSFTSPLIQLTPLIFAVSACVLGGISVEGGRGTVLGITFGVISLSILQETLSVLASPTYVVDMVTGGLLVLVALVAAPDLRFGRIARNMAAAATIRSGAAEE
jgi:ribose/xylose/arabinose/galactoside ABC-type transport system permease subunit